MKTCALRHTVLALLLLASVLAFPSCSRKSSGLKETPPALKYYSVPSAKIEYEYSGLASGNATHIIANYGMYQFLDENLTFKMKGQESRTHNLSITADTVAYTIDMVKKTGMRTPVDQTAANEMLKELTDAQKSDFQAAFLTMNGAEKKAPVTILGKQCDVYDMPRMGVEIALWKGLALRKKIHMGQGSMSVIMEAKTLELDYDATIDEFTPPEDVKISTIPNMPAGHPPLGNKEK